MDERSYSKTVRDQYEDYPYPSRNPEDERQRLLPTDLGFLQRINHHCFKGRQRFDQARILVAGGGTGDTSIFLAEQLRRTESRIVHLDMSQASIDIAKGRAEVRGLSNIDFIHHSIMELPDLGLAPFDYVDCYGVLHHLPDPPAGLRALKAVLNPDIGGMGLMLYAPYGRTGIYHMQKMLRLIDDGDSDAAERIETAKKILANLPATNWYKRSEKEGDDWKTQGDIGIYDLFLHGQDRAYSIEELYEFIDEAGLHFAAFENRLMYMPEPYFPDPKLMAKIQAMPLRRQQAIVELFCGYITRHTFYISNTPDSQADPGDPDMVPYFFTRYPDNRICNDLYNLDRFLEANPGQTISITLPGGMGIQIAPGPYTQSLFRHLDGEKCLQEIFDAVRRDFGKPDLEDRELSAAFDAIYSRFNLVNTMFLRHKSVGAFKSLQELAAPRRN